MNRIAVFLLIDCFIGVVSCALAFTAYFTNHWSYHDSGSGNSSRISAHGLWTHSLQNLNCDFAPISICMYIRAALSTSLAVAVPALLLLAASTVILLSGGAIRTSAYLAKSSAISLLITGVAGLVGILLYTLQVMVCISMCPPDYQHYANISKKLSFGFSFYFSWVSCGLFLLSSLFSFIGAFWTSKKQKIVYNMENTSRLVEGSYYGNRM